jgi:hypothetical protein
VANYQIPEYSGNDKKKLTCLDKSSRLIQLRHGDCPVVASRSRTHSVFARKSVPLNWLSERCCRWEEFWVVLTPNSVMALGVRRWCFSQWSEETLVLTRDGKAREGSNRARLCVHLPNRQAIPRPHAQGTDRPRSRCSFPGKAPRATCTRRTVPVVKLVVYCAIFHQ